ncbi:MAG: hypothetical protein MUC36_16845 [Planctomycetes bacterium]|jgi:hypothetical protein|nr:hypothetical protein [Planctomycetota bacterium]
MTELALLPAPERLHPATLRLRCFALLLAASTVVGGIGGASMEVAAVAFLFVWMPAYLLWVFSDLRVRGVVGMALVVQLLISIYPHWGLLLYMLWSRRLAGVIQWMGFVAAVWIPALLAAGFSYGIAQVVRGERW